MKHGDSNILEVKDLEVHTVLQGKTVPILRNLGFSISPGEVVGLVGPSGSGKTMTGRAILGLLPDGIAYTRGQIMFSGPDKKKVDLIQLNQKALDNYRKENVAMIFQNPGLSLNPAMRISAQFKAVSRLIGMREDPSGYRQILRDMGFNSPERVLNAYPHQLSGGELQRVIIGMTILKSPRLWIADEPTTALDTVTRLEIIRLLKRVKERLGAAMLYISHDIKTVAKLADRVAFMQAGTIENMTAIEHVQAEWQQDRENPVWHHANDADASRALEGREKKLLVADQISRSFGQRRFLGMRSSFRVSALKEVTFSMDAGEVLGLIGPSGSGKSTLARILTGLDTPDSGSIRYLQTELTTLDRAGWREIRKDVQLIHQNPQESLSPHRTVEQHLQEALKLSGEHDTQKAVDSRIRQLLGQLKLPEALLNRFPFQMSGGECQRVAIARSIAVQPSLVICDEITSALDRTTQDVLIDLMLGLKRERGFSLIWITHDLDVIRQVATRIILMDAGSIAEEADTETFFRKPVSEQGKMMLRAYREFDRFE